jgi:nucleotide-binding universal stress UspA family protein
MGDSECPNSPMTSSRPSWAPPGSQAALRFCSMAAGLLIAFDGSAEAGAAVRAAAVLFPGARATVLTIHEPAVRALTAFRAGGALMSPELVEQNLGELERELVGEAEAAAAEGARLAVAAGLAAEPAVAPGERRPWEPILTTAAEHGADVVVCGTRGRGAVARSVLGSTSSSLLHHADRAVLIVPEGGAPADGPVLIAYDGSPAAREAIAAVGRLLPGRRTLVVHAWESALRHSLAGRALIGVPVHEIREFSDDLETWLREAAEATVEEGVELARTARLDVRGEAVESGSTAWRVLAATAETRDAAVVVSGSQGHGAVASVLLGSVSSGLVHHAERPTLIVRAPAP